MNTGLSSFQPGYVATKLQQGVLESASLEVLFSELTQRLTALEKLGLLSVTGLSLKSSLVQMATLSTDGLAGNVVLPEVSQVSSTTYTSRLPSGAKESLPDWRSLPRHPLTVYQNRGPTGAQQATMSDGIRGCTNNDFNVCM